MKRKSHKVSPRTLARFQKAAAKYGGKVLWAEWEPLGAHLVFDGHVGGWKVKMEIPCLSNPKKPYYLTATGRNVEDAIADIQDWVGEFANR